MKRKIILTFLLIICVFLTIFMFVYYNIACQKNVLTQTTPGEFTLDRSDDPFFADYELIGEWEYYPNELIFSDSSEEELSGSLGSSNPLKFYTDVYFGNPLYQQMNTAPEGASSTAVNPQAAHISIPSSYALPFNANQMSCTKASYRAIIHVQRFLEIDEDKINISFPGLIAGNYRIYINGKSRSPYMLSPWAYPNYRLDDASDIEIVIEVSNTSQILNICPRLTTMGLTMTFFDSNKNIFLVMTSVLFAAILMLLTSVFSIDSQRFRLYFLVGLIFTALFAVNDCWVTGYIDSITNLVPMHLLTYGSGLIFIGGLIVTILILCYSSPSHFSKRYMQISVLTLCMVAVLHTIALFTNFAGIFETCGNVLLFATIVLWLINFYHHIAYISFDLYIFQLGVLILVTGATGNQIYNRFGFPGKFLYLFPACIIAFVVLIFFASKFYQKQLLTHTQNLLKLEKEATKMQTAMLANQIKPHFLYNTLTIIQEMCYTEPEQAAEMIVHFSQYLRTNIDFMDYTELIPFVKELEHVENFLYIQKARFGESLHFEKEIDTTDFMIPPLSVQPIIENAIKYGIRHNDDQGSVTLTVREDAIGLHIEVRNSGPGFNESDLKQHHSIDNIRTRLASLLQGELRIHSTADVPGTVMEIFIPQTNIQRAGHYLHETGELQ